MIDPNEEIIDSEIQNNAKLFSANSIYIGSFIGTPIIGGILCAVNFKRLQNGKMAVRSVLLGIAITLLVIVVALNLPAEDVESIPSFVFSAFYALLSYLYVQSTLREKLAAHKENGGSFYPEWIAVAIGALVILAPFLIAALID